MSKYALCCESRDVRIGQAPSYPQKECSLPCREGGVPTDFSCISSPSASWLKNLCAHTENITSRSFLKGWDQQFGRQLTFTSIEFYVYIISQETLALNFFFSTLQKSGKQSIISYCRLKFALFTVNEYDELMPVTVEPAHRDTMSSW